MKSEYKTFIKKIKFYHILILGCFLCPLLISNSNRVNRQRAEEKLNEEKSRLFNKIISGRYLEGEEKEKEEEKSNGTDEVCKRGSDELNNYYKTGNLDEIKLKDEPIKSEDKDKDYMKAIINIIKTYMKGDGNEDDDKKSESPQNPGGTEGGHRNLDEDESKKDDKEGEGSEIPTDDILAYGKHLLPVLIFFVIAILCIPGWLMCCFCCCCNCCCCCCCKKPCCKIPCFVITYALYALVVAVCIYGISQSNHIFVGIADTECSILRFFDEILEGELKTETPRWAGFTGIIDILDGMSKEITDMKTSTKGELDNEMEYIKNNKTTFQNIMTTIWKRFTDSITIPPDSYKNIYSNEYNFLGGGKDGQYVLDLIKLFGYYDSVSEEKKFVSNISTLYLWEMEYKEVSGVADENMERAHSGFTGLLEGNIDEIINPLEDAKGMVGNITETFNGIKGTIADMIVDNSETIDEYGKLGIKAVFGVLALLNVAIAAFMLLLCFCSGKCCTKCCCCRCICKLFTHILWNILALLMIIVFLVGSLFALIGKVGSDAMSVISYVVSDDNIGEGGDGVLLDQIEEYKNYTTRCIGGDGKIEEELGLDLNQINSINNISDAENQIKDAKREFTEKKDFLTYNHYIQELEKRVDYNDLKLVPVGDINYFIDFNSVFTEMKDLASSLNENWEIGSGDSCSETTPSYSPHAGEALTFDLKKCDPLIKYPNSNSNIGQNLKNKAQIISDFKKFVENANKEDTESVDSPYYRQTLVDLRDKYDVYLTSYINALDKFNSTIHRITGKLDEYTGGAGAFSFANCNFIGTNLKIILKYLNEVFGGDIYTIGVCLILVGCSLALSISFTILLIVVINANIDANKSKK